MEDTKKIRSRNTQSVREALRSTGGATKQEVAHICGLSQATCNTILNEMEQRGEAVADKIASAQVGRRASRYTLNSDYLHILCLYVRRSREKRELWYGILNFEGEVLEEAARELDCLNEELLVKTALDCIARDPKITCISAGIAGGVQEGSIRYCDVEELAGVPLKEILEKATGLVVCVEKDMRLIAYGFTQKGYTKEYASLSVILMEEGVCPGTATVLDGKIVRGATGLAGEAGFVPCGISWEEQAKLWKKETFFPFARQTAAALIVYLNPECVVVSGNLTDEMLPERLTEACQETIPKEDMPKILWIPQFHEFYVAGLFAEARTELEQKEL